MTTFLDTTALVGLALDGPERAVVAEALDQDDTWAASALALAEAVAWVDRLTDEPILRADLEDALRHTWDHLHVVPVDARGLDDAAALARAQPIPVASAIHLAAARRLPAPVRYVTFDATQLAVALGFPDLEVISR